MPLATNVYFSCVANLTEVNYRRTGSRANCDTHQKTAIMRYEKISQKEAIDAKNQ